MGKGYTCIWEFHVPPGLQPEFELHYGREGTWARLFRQSPGYIETLLLKDRSTAGHYLTVDRWHDEEAYLCFRTEFAEQYGRLDSECARLTTSEREIGAFSE